MLEIGIALAPLLVLVASLLAGRYPGHETIVRLAERLGSRQRPRLARTTSRRPDPWPRIASGGLLIALGIATRPPPLSA